MRNKFEAGIILIVSILLIAVLDVYFQIEQSFPKNSFTISGLA